MSFYFDRAFDVPLMVLAGEQAVPVYSLVSARIYNAQPSTAQLEDSANVLGGTQASSTTMTSEGQNRYLVTFSAIADPEPTSSGDYETYYVVFSIKLQSGGSTIYKQKPILIYRTKAATAILSVTAIDVISLDQSLNNLFQLGEIDQKINMATERLLRKMRGLGRERARLAEDDLRMACIYLAAAYCFREKKDIEKMNSYFKEYAEIISDSPIGYDADASGLIVPSEETSTGGSLYFLR